MIQSTGYKVKALKEISTIQGQYGAGASAISFDIDKGRYLRITDIQDNGQLKDEKVSAELSKKDRENYLLEKSDILFARSGATVGKTYIHNTQEKHYFAGYLIRFRVNPKIAYPPFVYNYTKTSMYKQWVEFKQRVVAQPNINAEQYGNELKIPLPPLKTQKQIAQVLDRADVLIRLRRQSIEKLDVLIESLFIEMFGDPVVNPMGWEMEPLDSFGAIITGNTPSRKNNKYYDDNYIEWIKTDNIFDTKLHPTEAKEYLSQLGEKNGRCVNQNALLVTCIAGSIKSIGVAALTDRRVAFNQQINAIQPNQKVEPTFLYMLFQLSRKYFQNHSTSGMKRIITKGVFQKVKMIKPPIELQRLYAIKFDNIETQKSRYQASLTSFQTLFDSLMQRAFEGELEFNDAAFQHLEEDLP